MKFKFEKKNISIYGIQMNKCAFPPIIDFNLRLIIIEQFKLKKKYYLLMARKQTCLQITIWLVLHENPAALPPNSILKKNVF